ncbi:MAG: 16S rRNA (uracil(1498)-N(3))-methyltransferase [Lactobacillales bacterium]|jgi:16S rRNA (uracil1498-N3)-methyltransferase|nr:16S rRNA (uracil(1498)-N(3))-methyltransferase [Lactobacillales bacterium]
MQRYFLKQTYDEKEPLIVVADENVHHMKNVMRMEAGNVAYLVFQNGVSMLAEVAEVLDDRLVYKAVQFEESMRELPSDITIATGFPKGDKLELIVQKGTELGAHEFKAFPAKWSVVKWDGKKLAKKQERLTKIAQEAAEQSHRTHAPEVELLTSEKQLVELFESYDTVLVAYEESAKEGERANLAKTFLHTQAGNKILAIFGPEGGFAPEEIEEFQAQGALLVGLGPRIMRAETAPLYLLAAASYQWELL